MPEEIDNKKIMQLLAHTYATAKVNHQLLLMILDRNGDLDMKEMFPILLERVQSNVHATLQSFGVEGYQGPELSDANIDDLLK